MNWFKKTFGKKHWTTVYTCTCSAKRSGNFGLTHEEVDARVMLQVEKERNLHRCYYTDGNLKTKLDISVLAIEMPDVIQVLEAYHIPY